uniref:Uncharacterized protein n=1 Tax=Setaria viridis TaxID=4556 RepID=A0A4U6UMP5_SETVI|nr:hypothetical protein SEVIR_5G282600v2 [Setaria viridis]
MVKDGALHPGLNTDGQRIASRCMKSLSPSCSLPAAGCNFAGAQESGARQADRQVLRLPRRARKEAGRARGQRPCSGR